MFEKLAEDIITRYLEKLAFLANKNNFTHNTSATFSKTTKRPDREPDSISPKKNSGSEYWYMPFGVIRGSDHWGEVGTCNWRLAGSKNHPGKKVYGFSAWENFDKMKKPVTKTAEVYKDITRLPIGIPRWGRLSIIKDDMLGPLEFIPENYNEDQNIINFNSPLSIGRRKTPTGRTVREEDPIMTVGFRKPVKAINTASLTSISPSTKELLKRYINKRIVGFNKTAAKKVLKDYYTKSPEEKEDIRNALRDNEIAYLSDKPLGQGWEGAAYPVLTKDLGEAVRKNFNGCFGEPDHLGRMLELSNNGADKPKLKEVWDLYRAGDYDKAYELYTKGNPRRMMKNRLAQRLDVLLNPDNADLFAALSKAQPRKTREMIGGGRRSSEKGPGAIVMEKLDIPANGQEEFSEADFAAMNSELASRILKAHIGDSPAFGTDFPDHFEPGNGKIGPNMRFHPVLRGIDGELYRIKDIRNVFDPSVLPPDRESAFHNLGFDKNHKLKIYDFDSDPGKV